MKNTETSLVLRVCRADYTAHGGFRWPSEVGAVVEAPDWEDTEECGAGLHGWLYGAGDACCVSHWQDEGAHWYVLEVQSSSIRMLDGKCKFPRAVVRFIGGKAEAAAYLIGHEPRATHCAVIGASRSVGDGSAVEVGALGTATAGYSGTATAGYSGTATAGDRGTATAGDEGTATAGDRGTATAGDEGTATAGDYGTATAGYSGTATAGYSGTATAGYSGTVCVRWCDHKAGRYRLAIGYVGEGGIKPGVAYRANERGELVEVKP